MPGPGKDNYTEKQEEQTAVDLSAYVEPPTDDEGVRTLAIEGEHRNTAYNPSREATSTVPTLVRRMDSQDVMPKPFKSTSQLLCCSFLSISCFVFFAAFAISNAFEAKQKRNAGNYTAAISGAKRARGYLRL